MTGSDWELSTEIPPLLMFSIRPRTVLLRLLSDAQGASLHPRNSMVLGILRERRLSELSLSSIREIISRMRLRVYRQ